MASDYFVYGDTLLDGAVAKASDVKAEFLKIDSGFSMLPKPNTTGDGFAVAIKAPDATLPDHLTTKRQMDVHTADMTALHDTVVAKEALISQHYVQIDALAADLTNIDAVALDLANVDIVATNITGISGIATNLTAVLASSTNASNALASEQKAAKWADEAENVEVEPGKYSAKHWATKAANVVAQGVIDDAATSTLTTWSSQKISDELSTLKALALSGL